MVSGGQTLVKLERRTMPQSRSLHENMDSEPSKPLGKNNLGKENAKNQGKSNMD